MSIQINGKKYVRAYFNGRYYSTGYYNGKCVMLMPDYNDYLLSGKDIYLKTGKEFFLSYKNAPQVLQDTLSGREIVKTPLEVAFDVHRGAIGAGTTFLFDLPGVMQVKAEQNTLFFKFPWDSADVWKYVPAKTLSDGWNHVALQGDGEKIILSVNQSKFPIVDESTAFLIQKASGFAKYNYMYSNFTASESKVSTWEWQVGIDLPNSLLENCRIVQDRDRYDAERIPKMEIYQGKCQMAVPGSSYPGTGIPIELNSSAIFRFTFDGKNYTEAKSVDFGKTFSVIKSTSVDASFTLSSGATYWQCWGGRKYDNLASCVFENGIINLSQTHIKINGKTVIDGANYGFTKDAGISIYDDYGYPNGEYPTIKAGSLQALPSWMVLKNIEALDLTE